MCLQLLDIFNFVFFHSQILLILFLLTILMFVQKPTFKTYTSDAKKTKTSNQTKEKDRNNTHLFVMFFL